MSSNRIYGKVPPLNLYGPFHYLYRITNIVEQKYYYGIRTPPKNITPQEDLGIKYFSSSKDKYFREDQKKHPENYKYKIVAIKKTRKEIINLEIFLHEKFNVGLNSKFYNRSKQTSNGYDATGKIPVKDIFGNIFQVTTNDTRLLSGELVHHTKGWMTTKDNLGKIHHIQVDDPRYISGDLVHIAVGMILVKDKNGKKFYISISDPRYLSGELVHFTKNTICVKDAAGKIFRVASTDPRYTNGELVGSTKGIKPKKKSCVYCGGTFAVGPFALFHGENCKYNPINKNENFKIKVNTVKMKCEHCGKISSISNHSKWHGDNCKLNPTNLVQ